MKVLILTVLFVALGGYASVLEPGQRSGRIDLGYSQATGLWKGKTFSNFAGDGKTNDFAIKYSRYFGLSGNLQLGISIQYRDRKYLDGTTEAKTVQPGDSLQSIPEIGFTMKKSLWSRGSSELDGFFGVRAPGDDKRGGQFLEGSDGTTKYDLGVHFSHSMSLVGFETGFTYTHRPGIHSDITSFDLSVPFYLSNMTIGPMISAMITSEGNNIGDDAFKASGLNFSLNKEDYTIGGLFVGFPISEMCSMDVNLYQKLEGRNTDKAMGFGIGFSWNK